MLIVHLGFELLESNPSSLIAWTETFITCFPLSKKCFCAILPWDLEGNVNKMVIVFALATGCRHILIFARAHS